MILINTLKELYTNKSVATRLYEEIFHSEFYAIIANARNENLTETNFLIYETSDNIDCLPLFTQVNFVVPGLAANRIVKCLSGKLFWQRIYEVTGAFKIQVEIDPLQEHGIRLTAQMILGMISMHG